MPAESSTTELIQARDRVVAKVRELRLARGWTQSELSRQLGLSQARLSEIERGQGSLSAEQLLVVLGLFNVDISEFLPSNDVDDELQNALIHFGARHLRPIPRAPSTGRFRTAEDLIVAVLLRPSSARFVTALAPVLVERIDEVSLPTVRSRLAETERQARLGWLIDNLHAVLPGLTPKDLLRKRKIGRLIIVISNELMRFAPPALVEAPDLFDVTIRSQATLERVWGAQASELSRRWGLATAIQPGDFFSAVESAYEHD